VAAGLALGAAALFDRFDSAPLARPKKDKKDRRPANNLGIPPADPLALAGQLHPLAETTPASSAAVSAPSLLRNAVVGRAERSSLPKPRFSLFTLLAAELRLLLKGQRWWWYAGAAGLILAGLLNPPLAVRQIVLPLTWLWPILVWSALGSREKQHGTGPIVFSAAWPLARQLPAAWLAGAVVAALTGAGAALTLLRGGDFNGLLAWGVGALFIPALALALGTLSGGSKLFEMLYVLLWYMGPMSDAPGLDFIGARQANVWPFYLAAAFILLAVAWAERWRQLRQ
jgi:hypothetical protein